MGTSLSSSNVAVGETISRAAAFLKNHEKEDGVSPTYGYFTRHPVAPLNRKRLKILLEETQAISLKLGRPLRILDLACGGGIITCALGALGHRVLGMDLSHREIQLAKNFAQEQNRSGVFWQADLLNDSSWERVAEETLGGKPDIIVLAYALHHLPGVEEFIQRLGRWLAPGASLLINEENPDAPLFRLKHVVRTWIQKDTETEWHRTWNGWKQLLDQSSFRTALPRGADIVPGLGRIAPLQAWSLVFTATRI